jgi:cytochrome c oxidase cbb3-type subunit III
LFHAAGSARIRTLINRIRRFAPYVALVGAVLLLAGGVTYWRLRGPSITAEQRAAIDHGRDVYGRMCSVCHGDKGEGYKADQAPNLANPEFLASVSDAFLRKAITDGRQNTTMSAWGQGRGGPLKKEDIDAVVAFLRSWESKPRVVLDEAKPSGRVHRGEPIYNRECKKCHGERGVGGPNVAIGNPELLTSASNGFLRHAISNGRPGTAMPAFHEKLDKKTIDDLLVMLRQWEKPKPPPRQPPAKPAPLELGPVPLNPKGPEPKDFQHHPKMTGVDIVHAALEKKAKLAILDARASSDYLNEHIAGSVSVPFYDAERYLAQLPKDAWMVAYCACPHAESGKLAKLLVDKGFKKVTVLDEGIGVWKRKGYGVAKGDKPYAP